MNSKNDIIDFLNSFLSDKRNLDELKAGRSSLSGDVSFGGKTIFLKICTDKLRLVRLENEYSWLNRIASVNTSLAPKVYCFTKPNIKGIAGGGMATKRAKT